MNKQERIARLLNSLVNLGFTYSEAQRLRRIEKTLNRWAVDQCNGDIQRDEETGKPVRVITERDNRRDWFVPGARYPIPDRETGALKQLAAIMARVNGDLPKSKYLVSYHQGDPRGCSLYIVPVEQLKTECNQIVEKARSWGGDTVLLPCPAFPTEEAAALNYLKYRGTSIPARDILPVDQYYDRGVAVCA